MTSKHRVRHTNAYRAGCRDGARFMSDTMRRMLPPEYHEDLERLTKTIVSRPEWRGLVRDGRDKKDG